MEDKRNVDADHLPEDAEDQRGIERQNREFGAEPPTAQAEPVLAPDQYELQREQFRFEREQAELQSTAAKKQRHSTMFLGVCSMVIALILGIAQVQMQFAQNELAKRQSELANAQRETQADIAQIGLDTARCQAQADLLLALGTDDKRPRQAARALAQFRDKAVPPLVLILLKEQDGEILDAKKEAFLAIHEYEFQKGNGNRAAPSKSNKSERIPDTHDSGFHESREPATHGWTRRGERRGLCGLMRAV